MGGVVAQDKFHTVVVGGGCLGCASAISIKRRLGGGSERERSSVCLIERSVVGSGVTARHSGIVRAANAVPEAALLAQRAIAQWRNLESLWGVAAPFEVCGAIWIAKDAGPGKNSSWDALEPRMKSAGIEFGRITRARAGELRG
jgi:sarcosine oxidase subunit beta